jgi:hypothetical protein
MTSEKIFQLLQQSKWEELLEFERNNRKEIVNDILMKQVFDTYFIDALLLDLEKKEDKLYSYVILKNVYQRFIQHRNLTYNISEESFEKLVIQYLKSLQSQNELKTANHIANTWVHLDDAKEFIDEYKKTQPKEISHSREEIVKVSINPNIQKENHMISLFKSKQEYEFFYAIREYYPNYFTYPNVAISCIIDYEKIKNNLIQKERDYFFKAIVDNVVYVQTNENFIPKFYFELDSIYHDLEAQKEKDKIKDKFFSLSGQKLIRIRATENNQLSRMDFKQMISEILS